VYRIYGYKGKQVRDNIHSLDVARFIAAFHEQPRCGEVYNIGGGRSNSCSIREAVQIVESLTGKKFRTEYTDQNRKGDHICYISDLSKMRAHYPGWNVSVSLPAIIEEIVRGLHTRQGKGSSLVPSCVS
jgi:CDP-paratose 2-epimerase